MQKIILIVGSLLFTACQQKEHGAFVISGNIAHAPSSKIYLQELPYDGSQPIIVDSSTLEQNGDFKLNATGKEENLYIIALDNGPQLYLINDNNKIEVKYDVNNYRYPSFQHSPASSRLYQFVNTYLSKDSAVRSHYTMIDSLAKLTPADSSLQVLQQKGLQQVRAINDYIKEYIKQADSPAEIFFAINRAMQSMPKEEVKALIDAATSKFTDHTGLARLQKTMEAITATTSSEYSLLNQQAPNLTMQDVNGQSMSISQFKGKYVLVDFWASWCGPCRQENPAVVAAYHKFKDKNFTIVGISLDADKSAWLQAIQKDGLSWNHMSDLKQWESTAVNAYQFEGIPFNVLLDPSGKIIAYGLRGNALERKLSEVLK